MCLACNVSRRVSPTIVQSLDFGNPAGLMEWITAMGPGMDIYLTSDCLDVKKAALIRSTLEEADLTGSLFSKVRMTNLTVREADIANSKFENSSLSGSTFKNVDFKNVALEHCALDEATIDGIRVTDLLAAYRAAHS